MINVTGKTDMGLVRNTNQDYFDCGKLPDNAAYIILCDGMGGANGGSIASEAAVQLIKSAINRSFRAGISSNSIRDILFSAITSANAVIYEKSQEDEELRGMGTTVVAAILYDGFAYIAHVGDSRAYHITKVDITQLTKDHSKVQMLVDSGEITEEAARVHPEKHIITRAVGVSPQIDIDYGEVTFFNDDVLIVCTDGLSNYLTGEEIYECVNNCPDFDRLPVSLVDIAKSRGGADNITVSVAYH